MGNLIALAADYGYEYSYQSELSGGQILLYAVLGLALSALMWWKVFEKAGQPGWASIVPIYNYYVLTQVAKRPGWWLLLLLIPIVNFIVLIIIALDVARNFGKGAGFAVGLVLLPIIFYPILGFGSARYEPKPA